MSDRASNSSVPPSGTVTFMFTDIEGSTQLVQQLTDEYAILLADQRSILRTAFEKWTGHEVDTQGDAFFVAFTRASDAVNAAVDAQRALADYIGPQGVTVRVRTGLHTAESHFGANGYVGIDVHRAARICAAGHGGQVLLSQTTYDLLESSLPQGVGWRDLGKHRLKDLNRPQRLYQLELSDLPNDFPPLKSLDVFPNNLPIQPTSFIGREREMAEIKDLLFKTHLLTLTGAGGSGKTRLAEQVATELLENFADGVWLAELSALTDSTFVVPAISSAVGYREASDRPIQDALIEYLHPKKLLLLLDNCEHLITSCAEFVNRLLHACPQLKILVTSREALHVRGEYLYAVPPLGLPRTNFEPTTVDQVGRYEAVRLFVDRAQSVRSDFMLTDENSTAVVDICLRLDGLPLAIELAAARVRMFSPHKLHARLESRLKLLRGGARDLPLRQQTLRSTIEWSYELLDEEEQRIFALFSVFSSSTFEAIETVAGRITSFDDLEIETFDGLESLVGKSLKGDQGLARFREGKALYQGVKSPPVFWPAVLLMEAGACALAGKVEEGLTILDEVADITGGTSGGVMLVADALSLKGDLLLAKAPSNSNEAEACYQQAINIARPLEARMPQLRAATRLSRLWRDQGKADRAAQLLREVYQTFNEGFAAADLMEAKALLDELS